MAFHPLLTRQLRRLGIVDNQQPTVEELANLLNAVQRAYTQADDDRYTLERSLSIAGEEMQRMHEARRLEEADRRRAAELRYGSLVANLPGAVYRCRADSVRTIVYLSDGIESLVGSTATGERWEALSAVVHPDDRLRVDEAVARALARCQHYALEYRILLADGSQLWVQDRGRVVDEEGTTWLDGILLDDSERRMALDEARAARVVAEQATQAKSAFLANMTHELRTPLNAVIGASDLLMRHQLSGPVRDLLTLQRHSAQSLLELIDDLLDFSKAEANKLDLEIAEFSVQETLEQVMNALAPRASSKGVELGAVTGKNIPHAVLGDGRRTRQVLLNFVGNAIKFTEQGQVRIDVVLVAQSHGRATIRFEVRDTGIGVPLGAHELIFKPFAQADMSSTRNYGGTGLGLSISKQFVELMGGTIGFETQPGHGSTFWFEVPFSVTKQTQDAESTLLLDGRRVLVIDASPHVRALVSDQLGALGALPLAAETAAEACAALQKCDREGAQCAFVFISSRSLAVLGDCELETLRDAVSTSRLVEIHEFGAARAESPLGPYLSISKPLSSEKLRRAAGSLRESPQVLVASSGRPELRFSGRRVLVAEDNRANQRILTLQLQAMGVAADVAENGEQALEALGRRTYPLVLMDCQMPVMDGFEATRRIRLRERGTSRRTRIVALTALAHATERQRCLDAGMDDFMAKPVVVKDIEACFARFLGALPPASLFSDPPPSMILELAQVGGAALIEDTVASWSTEHAARLETLRTLVETEEVAEAHGLAHALRGLADMSGFEELARVLGEVETQLAQGGQCRAAAMCLQDVRAAYERDLSRVRRALRNIVAVT